MGRGPCVPPAMFDLGDVWIAGILLHGGILTGAEGNVEADGARQDDSGAEHEVTAVHGDRSSMGSRATSAPRLPPAWAGSPRGHRCARGGADRGGRAAAT